MQESAWSEHVNQAASFPIANIPARRQEVRDRLMMSLTQRVQRHPAGTHRLLHSSSSTPPRRHDDGTVMLLLQAEISHW